MKLKKQIVISLFLFILLSPFLSGCGGSEETAAPSIPEEPKEETVENLIDRNEVAASPIRESNVAEQPESGLKATEYMELEEVLREITALTNTPVEVPANPAEETISEGGDSQ